MSYLPPRRVVALLGVLLLAPAYSYAQQAAEDVLAQYASNLEERMDGIDDFTVQARLTGPPTPLQMTSYYRRTEKEMPAYENHIEIEDGPPEAQQAMGETDMLTMSRKFYNYFGETATYEGSATVDGEETHVIFVEDMTRLYDDIRGGALSNSSVEARNARLYIDTDQPVLRRMTVDIHVTQNGEQRTMKMETRMQDYRPVETMLFPYRRTVLMDYQLSEREKGQLRQRVQQFESAIEQAPEERRPKMRQQLAAMRAMMDGTTEIIFEAEDVRINTGVPDQYF